MSTFLRHCMTAGALALCAALPLTAQAEITESDRGAIDTEIRNYLMANPEVIVEALQAYQDKQQEQAVQADQDLVKKYSQQIFHDGYSWVGGNPKGDVTLVEFMDYRCGYCRKAYAEVEDLVKSDGNIRFVLKEFPILGQDSVSASKLALATRLVDGEDAYKAMHDTLMTYSGGFDETSMTRLIKGLGYDPKPVLAKMDSDEVRQQILKTRALAQDLQINGTPAFILGNDMLRGYLPEDSMKAIVQDQRK